MSIFLLSLDLLYHFMSQTQGQQNGQNKPVYDKAKAMSVQIPSRDSLKVSNPESSDSLRESPVYLPVQSARFVKVGDKKRKFNQDAKFIHTNQMNDLNSSVAGVRVGKIKNLIYRNHIGSVISQEKTRLASLEQTMMFQRERRFNKNENVKKYQRVTSPNLLAEKQKKFKRRDDKKQEDDKKFKRHKDYQGEPAQDGKMLQAKLIRRLRENAHGPQMSKIPEHNMEYTDSNLLESDLLPSSNNQNRTIFEENENQGILIPEQGSGLVAKCPSDLNCL